jgi:TetR/AcrR family transcriptional regulator, cholesterol catabolism regulator
MAASTATKAKPGTPRGPRQDNRRQPLLDAAAALFRGRGFHAVTMREIAREAGMLAGSVYYHFSSKDDLLVSVYEEGVRRITARVEEACHDIADPWARLEAACRAHTEMLLDESDYARVILKVMPEDVPSGHDQLITCRDTYEELFRDLVDKLPLAADVDRTMLRLTLIGALNSAHNWYRPDKKSNGGKPPGDVAMEMIKLFRNPLQEEGLQ